MIAAVAKTGIAIRSKRMQSVRGRKGRPGIATTLTWTPTTQEMATLITPSVVSVIVTTIAETTRVDATTSSIGMNTRYDTLSYCLLWGSFVVAVPRCRPSLRDISLRKCDIIFSQPFFSIAIQREIARPGQTKATRNQARVRLRIDNAWDYCIEECQEDYPSSGISRNNCYDDCDEEYLDIYDLDSCLDYCDTIDDDDEFEDCEDDCLDDYDDD